MYELTNEQRKCFALTLVQENWERVLLKPAPCDDFDTVAYVDGTVIRKCVQSGKKRYIETDYCEPVSDDISTLLPLTQKGKPQKLTAASLTKRQGRGMCLQFDGQYISLFSYVSEKYYYSNVHDSDLPDRFCESSIDYFSAWVDAWCADTSEGDISDVAAFANENRSHVKYKEGDVFRFKIGRRQYGFGRILLDYNRLRREKKPFWDILMSTAIVVSVYHVISDTPDISVGELKNKKSLPSCTIADNRVFYGEYEIIGNIPIGTAEDYPIMFGHSLSAGDDAVCLQYGETYIRREKGTCFGNFLNHGVGFSLSFKTEILRECIDSNSNTPYWERGGYRTDGDLRNPKYKQQLETVCRHYGISVPENK